MVRGLVAGRLALVTGAGSGIGRAACQVLSREGATVVAADLNYDAVVETLKLTALPRSGNESGSHSAVQLDVSDAAAVKRALREARRVHRAPPTVVVNCAGVTRDNWLLQLSEEDFDTVQRINLKGTFLVMQACSQALVEASLPGSIVNLSSIVGKYGNMGQTNYAGSKAGVIGMTQSAAKELGRHKIRVNAILPGPIKTPIIKTVPDKVIQGMLQKIPLGRLGEAEEVAELIVFLSSDKSSYITGAAIDISGGY